MHMTEGEGDGTQRLSVRGCVFVVKRRSKIKRVAQRGNRHKERMKKQKGKVHAGVCDRDREGGQLLFTQIHIYTVFTTHTV